MSAGGKMAGGLCQGPETTPTPLWGAGVYESHGRDSEQKPDPALSPSKTLKLLEQPLHPPNLCPLLLKGSRLSVYAEPLLLSTVSSFHEMISRVTHMPRHHLPPSLPLSLSLPFAL